MIFISNDLGYLTPLDLYLVSNYYLQFARNNSCDIDDLLSLFKHCIQFITPPPPKLCKVHILTTTESQPCPSPSSISQPNPGGVLHHPVTGTYSGCPVESCRVDSRRRSVDVTIRRDSDGSNHNTNAAAGEATPLLPQQDSGASPPMPPGRWVSALHSRCGALLGKV